MVELEPLAVWTDFGGVLTPPVAESVAAFCEQAGLSVDLFHTAMREVAAGFGVEDAMAPLDTPLVDQFGWERLMERAVARHGVRASFAGFPDRWFADRPTNDAWLDELLRLRASGLFIGMLSNMPPGWDEHWRKMVDPQSLFDDVVLSFQAGCRKPQAAIFKLAGGRCGLPPERCVLIDDSPANCAGAREAGWRAIHFEAAEPAIAALRSAL